ncbi:O-antigen ligase family protein [Ginsengibacter hankyongi]|uniref:O-antigen ligase family protein n=2 Tax=Ginsengibacter hankyongi TaxID=2607284 RepID=A0A5J5IKC3_9BACT|nr:O-antigen ligase family protein [Ginsengibacter hankyongi]
MPDSLFKRAFIVYICLTLIEYGLLISGNSLLKFYGYAITFGWLFLGRNKMPNAKESKEIIFFAIYLILAMISLLWSDDVATGSYYLLSMANMIVLILVASTLSWNKRDLNVLLFAFQLSATIFSIFLIIKGQLYHGFSRSTLVVNGLEQDPNNLSAMLVIPTLISLWRILNKQYITLLNRKYIVINYLFLGSCILAMLMLSSRGGLFGLICGSLFLLFFHNRFAQKNKIRSNKLYIITSIAIVCTILFFFIPHLDQETLKRLSFQRIREDKGSDRLLIWNIAFQQFLTAPLFGIGIGSFQGITKVGVHNQFIIVGVESGIVGFILFATSLIILFIKSFKSKTSLLPALLVGTFVVIFFLDAYNKKYFWNGILLSIIILTMEKNSRRSNNQLIHS